MSKVALINSVSDHGGYMMTATGHLTNNGLRVCVTGDMHHCPRNGHGNTPVTGTSSVSSEGKSLIKVGDKARCGATITGGGTFNVG